MLSKEEMALEALLKIVCELKNNGKDFVNVIGPLTMKYAEEAIAKNGWEVKQRSSWVPGFTFFHPEKAASPEKTDEYVHGSSHLGY